MSKSPKKSVRAWQRKLLALCFALLLLAFSVIGILSTTLPIAYAASTGENGAISLLPTFDIPTAPATKKPTKVPKTPKPDNTPTFTIPTITIGETPVIPTIEATATPKPTPTPVPPTATPQGMLYPTVISTAKPQPSPTSSPAPSGTPTAGVQPTPAEITGNSGSSGEEDGMMGILLPIGGLGVMVLAGAAAVVFGLQAQKKKKGQTAHRMPAMPAPSWSPMSPTTSAPMMQSGWASQSQWESQFGQHNPVTAQQPAISDANATQVYHEPPIAAPAGLQTYAPTPVGTQRNQGFAQLVGQSMAGPPNGTMLTTNMLNEQATTAAPTNWPSSPNNGGMSQPHGNMLGNGQPASGASFAPINTPRPQINDPGSPDASSIRRRSASVHADISSEIEEIIEQEKVKKAQKQAAQAPQPVQGQPVHPLDDPFLEAIMRQAQQGIFALPNKDEQGSTK